MPESSPAVSSRTGDASGGNALDVRDLNAFYDRAQVLQDVTLSVRRGEAVALLGRNGAGKSTSLRAMMGLVRRTGRICVDGRDLSGLDTPRIARAGLGYVPEERRIFTDLTVMENLEVGRRAPRPGLAPWTVERLFELFPNLAEMRGRLGGRMSGGEQQMLALARTLMGNPSVLLLDEPSEGLAPLIVEQMARAILALKAEGLSLLLSEQNFHFARLLCTRCYGLSGGRVVYCGLLEELGADRGLREALLSV